MMAVTVQGRSPFDIFHLTDNSVGNQIVKWHKHFQPKRAANANSNVKKLEEPKKAEHLLQKLGVGIPQTI